MPNYLPRWLLNRLKTLWMKFEEREFSFEEAKETLNDDSRIVALVLSKLVKNDWIETHANLEDSRKAIYKIKHSSVVREFSKINTEK